MALTPTIYKFRIDLADLDQDIYLSEQLTVACHPSETAERMMARVLAWCLNAVGAPVFTKGLSTAEEPDLWSHELHGAVKLWIEVGEPSHERLKKACHQAAAVKVYCFNTKARVWWQQNQDKLQGLSNLQVYQLPWASLQQLAALVERSAGLSVTLSGDSAYLALPGGEVEVQYQALR